MVGGRPQRSKFTFCVLVILLNIGVHLLFWVVFSSFSLPSPAESQSKAPPDCRCPQHTTCPPPSLTSTQLQRQQPVSDDTRELARGIGSDVEVKRGAGAYNSTGGQRVNHLLAVLVLSSVDAVGRERRDTIRKTWMQGYRDRRQSVLVRFAVGTLELSAAELTALQSEQEDHRDLLLLPHLRESYYNLTRKVLYSFIELDRHFDFSFLLKCDDDTFLLLDTIYQELSERASQEEEGRRRRRSYYWGFFDGRATPKRSGKWMEKEWFLCDRYLPYALGGGYVLSSDLVHRIVVSAEGLQFYISEDVSVGVWLGAYEAERRHDTRFNTEFVSRGCRNSYIVSHKQSVQDMLSKHQLLRTRGVQCDKEYQTRASYEYDWSSPPSQCCERQKGVP